MSNMVVRTNTLALNSHRNLGMVGNQQARASARLSSGFRINSAADDAAGLGISENMRAQIRGLDQASRNAQDAISLVQTAEGGLNTINEMVIRVRELTVQAANDINTSEGGSVGTNESNRARIQGEINHIIDEIHRTAETLQFNGMTLLNGSAGTVTAGGPIVAGDLTDMLTGLNPANITALDLGDLATAINNLHAAAGGDVWDALMSGGGINASNIGQAQVAAMLSEFAAGAANQDNAVEWFNNNLGAINTALNGSSGLAFQVGANSGQLIHIEMPDIVTDVAGALRTAFGSPAFNAVTNMSNTGNVATGTGATITDLLDDVDEVLATATAARGSLGAIQNRLEFTIQNLEVSSENLSAANSRIRDADMAAEMMRLTQANVLQQAATAMLAQANQAPQSILQLLG